MGTHPVDPATLEVLKSLDALSSHSLLRRDDLAILLDAAAASGRQDVLDTLSFEAKFVSQSIRLLERLGAGAADVQRLKQELAGSLERAGSNLRALLTAVDDADRLRMEEEYLALRPDAAKNLITLCHDLRWYKNLQIDRSSGRNNRPRNP
jgi:hypothetical protein